MRNMIVAALLILSLPATAEEAEPQMTIGNGQDNWIVTAGATRDGATMTFKEVQIDGNGWLVLHPFKDGKPVGEIYVGATYLSSGQNLDVEITVDTPAPPNAGDMFIVMLHKDVNENQEFDFVFVDERNVLDKAVFEGSTMIGHAIPAP